MKSSVLLASLCFVPLLAGCSGLSESLGFGRNPPDEFAVVDRPPLAMPPDYNLRPPKPGAPRPQETASTTNASSVLFGGAKVATTPDRNSSVADADVHSKTEKALLDSAGVAKADPNIREAVDRDAAEKVVGNEHLIDDLLWWRKKDSSGTTVDAAAEAERLKEAKEKGEPVNNGATPIIEKQKSGWLGL